jgi:hypothetical protein
MHFEIELALVIGKTVRDLNPEDTKGALDAIESTWASYRRATPHPQG